MSKFYNVIEGFSNSFVDHIKTEENVEILDMIELRGDKYTITEISDSAQVLTVIKRTPRNGVIAAYRSKKQSEMSKEEKALSIVEEEKFKKLLSDLLNQINSSKGAVIIHFKESNIPDIPFAYSPQYIDIPDELEEKIQSKIINNGFKAN